MLNLVLILALLRARAVALGALDQAVAVTNDIGNDEGIAHREAHLKEILAGPNGTI